MEKAKTGQVGKGGRWTGLQSGTESTPPSSLALPEFLSLSQPQAEIMENEVKELLRKEAIEMAPQNRSGYFSIHNPQERRWMATNHKPQVSEQVSPCHAFQDGEYYIPCET